MSTAFVNELILDEHISENIKKTVATLLHLFDHRNSSSYSHNDSVAFDTAEYIFQRLGSQISILTRDGREVMLNGQLTSFATDKDIRYLQLLSQLVDQYLSIAESGQPTEVTMLMVCIPSSIETLLEMQLDKRLLCRDLLAGGQEVDGGFFTTSWPSNKGELAFNVPSSGWRRDTSSSPPLPAPCTRASSPCKNCLFWCDLNQESIKPNQMLPCSVENLTSRTKMSSSVPFSGRLYTKAQFAQMIGVSPQTLTRWHKQKKIVAYQGYSRKMYYSGEHYINYLKTLGLSEQHIAKIVRSLENQKN